MQIKFLGNESVSEYDQFLKQSPRTLFCASNRYRLLLKEILQAEDRYFLALDDRGQIIGALPAFLKRNEKYGHILNSLPFFGSIGGIIEHEGNKNVKKALLDSFSQFAEQQGCISSTIITSPFDSNSRFYESEFDYSFKDERIGQVSELPDNKNSIEKNCLDQFRGSKRRNIRKAINSGIIVKEDNSTQARQFLSDTHTINIKSLSGSPKPVTFFESIPRYMTWQTDYKIYTAWKGQVSIAALLLFYFNKTVEYFTPAIVEDHRSMQPLSLLIFEAMKDATQRGFKWWNWGGTWKSQKGVYQFKSQFGSQNNEYSYFIKVKKSIDYFDKIGQENLLRQYPFFYTVPFERLKKNEAG